MTVFLCQLLKILVTVTEKLLKKIAQTLATYRKLPSYYFLGGFGGFIFYGKFTQILGIFLNAIKKGFLAQKPIRNETGVS
ncbi:MAG: hypothetical protein Q4B88_03305 [Moraxella sp.]|nr:hypothetical protein [Moraxella sp.]